MKFLIRFFFLQLIVCFFNANVSNVFAQENKYSIDAREVKTRHRFHISFKHLFQRTADQKAKKAKRKDDRKKRKANKKYLKAKKKYWKKLNHPKEYGKNRRVYRRMKKNEKRAIRQQKGGNPDPLIKRIFKKKKHKTKTVKSSN